MAVTTVTELPMNRPSLQPMPSPTFAPQMPNEAVGGMAGGEMANAPAPTVPADMIEDQRSAEEEEIRQAEMEQAEMVDQLSAFLSMINVAEKLDDQKLASIGQRVVEEYKIDLDSRREWVEKNREYIELARMIGGSKEWGGGTVSNVKYPALATAALQFAARAYPNIISGENVVKGKKIGVDLDGKKQKRADRMGTFMSWQLLEQMEGWDEDTDQLLVCLPIVGCDFRKTYRDTVDGVNVSERVECNDLVVHYFTKSSDWNNGKVPRITHHIPLYPNEIIERVRGGRFLDRELGFPVPKPDIIPQHSDSRDEDMPHLFLEQHRWEDLDGDGYKEPYVVTVHYDTEQVVRIVANYDSDGVETNAKGQIVRIKPIKHFTRYLFFPSLDGGFYGMGFGSLLGSMNKTINTSINQLLDAGTNANRQAGFLARNIRLPSGSREIRFKQGEWKYVDNTGDDLRKGIVPLPTTPPSPVLFQLLEFMVAAAEKLTSSADVLSGNQPQANVPATTTLALIEQALKIYSSIYLRIHKSLKKEFKKLKRLNRLYVTQDEYARVLDDMEANVQDFYDRDLDVTPVSDVSDLNDMQKVMKAQALRELVGQGLNDGEIYNRYLEALNVPDRQEILNTPAPKADPKLQIEQLKAEIKQGEQALKAKELELRAEVEAVKAEKTRSDTNLVNSRAETLALKQQIDALKFELDRERQTLESLKAHAESKQADYDRVLQTVDMEHQHEIDWEDRRLEEEKIKAAKNKPKPRQGE